MAALDNARVYYDRLAPLLVALLVCCAGCNLMTWHRVSPRRVRDDQSLHDAEPTSPMQASASPEGPLVQLTSYSQPNDCDIDPALVRPQFVLEDELRPLPSCEDEVALNALDRELTLDAHIVPPPVSGASLGLFESIVTDHGQFYSRGSLGLLVAGLGAGAALANSNADDWITNDFYQENIRNASTDEYFEAIHNMKLFGEGKYALPIYAIAATGGWAFDQTEWLSAPGEWGERSLRTVLVGGPPMLTMQWAVGGSRPGEAHSGSHWEPFNDNNGVSGHAFMGAIPFLNAAYMTDNPWLRAACYVGSGMAGLSRVNDDSHYTSQAVLGWWMAYLAARSVNATEQGTPVTPLVQLSPAGDTIMGLEYRW